MSVTNEERIAALEAQVEEQAIAIAVLKSDATIYENALASLEARCSLLEERLSDT